MYDARRAPPSSARSAQEPHTQRRATSSASADGAETPGVGHQRQSRARGARNPWRDELLPGGRLPWTAAAVREGQRRRRHVERRRARRPVGGAAGGRRAAFKARIRGILRRAEGRAAQVATRRTAPAARAGAAGAARRMRRVRGARRRQDVRPSDDVVSVDGTSYVKQVFTWPEAAGTTSAIVRFDVINEHLDVVHHMLIVKCAQDVSAEFAVADRERQHGAHRADHGVGRRRQAGGGCTPPGIAFGRPTMRAPPTRPWIRLEIHYDNPSNAEGIVDSSGMRITVRPRRSGRRRHRSTCADAKDAGLCKATPARRRKVASQASQLCGSRSPAPAPTADLLSAGAVTATQYASSGVDRVARRPHRCRRRSTPRCRRCR